MEITKPTTICLYVCMSLKGFLEFQELHVLRTGREQLAADHKTAS